jgi:hypothetical protein
LNFDRALTEDEITVIARQVRELFGIDASYAVACAGFAEWSEGNEAAYRKWAQVLRRMKN